jgi:hypothetical protein
VRQRLRRVTKALCALDRVISRESSRPAYLDTLSELELGLQVRRCYASFRAAIFAHGDVCDRVEDVEAHLRRAGHAIAVVAGQPIFCALRLHDREQLRSLQRRILGWLKSERRLVDGAAVWRDVCAFAAILRHIDRRQELIEHDSLVIRSALRSLTVRTETEETERDLETSLHRARLPPRTRRARRHARRPRRDARGGLGAGHRAARRGHRYHLNSMVTGEAEAWCFGT